jgi:hypothetical protein
MGTDDYGQDVVIQTGEILKAETDANETDR